VSALTKAFVEAHLSQSGPPRCVVASTTSRDLRRDNVREMIKGALILVAIAVAVAILASVLRDDPPGDDSTALRTAAFSLQLSRSS